MKNSKLMAHSAKIDSTQLQALTNVPEALHHISQKIPGGSLMQGDFLHNQQVSGIWIHVCRIKELQDAICTFERPPGLSFTFMFEGEAHFSIGEQEHSFKANKDSKSIECSAICLAQSEIISRKIRKGACIHKLNISIDRVNLESRCQLANDSDDIQRIFQQHGKIVQWKISENLKLLINDLMKIINHEDLLQRLHVESYASEILFHVLSSLKEESRKEDKVSITRIARSTKDYRQKHVDAKNLRNKIDILLDQSLELKDIAKQLNMSVSTLQRKFKTACGSTVIEYIRRKRLLKVRNDMIKNGISLNQAASLAGYKYPANFVTAFRKAFGRTPHAYCRKSSY